MDYLIRFLVSCALQSKESAVNYFAYKAMCMIIGDNHESRLL